MLRGIDVSSHQSSIDFVKVSVSNDFVIAKCTGGLSYKNPLYQTQVASARSAGLVVGSYHFAHESSVDGTGYREPEDEAAWFLAHADVQPGELVALDIEDTAIAGDLGDWALRWLRTVEAAVGCKPLLYTFPSYITEHGLGTRALASYPLWYAYYRVPERDNPWPPVPGLWERIAIWQWSGGSQVAGIPNDTDQNVYSGTIDDLRALGKPQPEQPQDKPDAPGMDSSAQTTGWYLNARGEAIVWANFGGNSTAIQGVNYADLGVTTTGQDGATYDRSIINGEWQAWVKR